MVGFGLATLEYAPPCHSLSRVTKKVTSGREAVPGTPFFSSADIGTAFAKLPVVSNSKGVTRVEILILVVGLCVGAAIVLPKVQEARVAAAEAEAVGDTRRVISAEQSYSSANMGFFDDLTRLCRQGRECEGIGIPGYPLDAPDFLQGDLARRSPYTKRGYVREWLGWSAVPVPPPGSSPTSVLDYCYRSTPDWTTNGGGSVSGTASGAVYTDAYFAYEPGSQIPCPIPAVSGFFE